MVRVTPVIPAAIAGATIVPAAAVPASVLVVRTKLPTAVATRVKPDKVTVYVAAGNAASDKVSTIEEVELELAAPAVRIAAETVLILPATQVAVPVK